MKGRKRQVSDVLVVKVVFGVVGFERRNASIRIEWEREQNLSSSWVHRCKMQRMFEKRWHNDCKWYNGIQRCERKWSQRGPSKVVRKSTMGKFEIIMKMCQTGKEHHFFPESPQIPSPHEKRLITVYPDDRK